MPHYTLTDNQKTLVRLMAQGIQDGSVNASWRVSTGDNGRRVFLFGANELLQQEFNSGRSRVSDLDLLVQYGLLFRNGEAYCLNEQMIFDAVNSDFEDEIDIQLEQQQENLLCTLVEAHRGVQDSLRTDFLVARSAGGTSILHSGLPNGSMEASYADICVLSHYKLLLEQASGNTEHFVVTPLGVSYYNQIRRRAGNPVRQVETAIQSYLNAERFWKSYPLAYRKWSEAADLLWRSDSPERLKTIGHLCREALQDFVTSLVDRFQPVDVEAKEAKTKNRFAAVQNKVKDSLGLTERKLLGAMYAYLDNLNEIIQRQVHGPEEGSLVWEDARRVVFQTAVVFFEIDSSFSRIGAPR